VKEVKLVVNALCDTKVKADRLISVLSQVLCLQFLFVSLRIRGEFSTYVKTNLQYFLVSPTNQISFRTADTYKSWKANTIEQIMHDGPIAEYVFLLQEDYRLMVDPSLLENYFNYGKISGHDTMLLLAGPYYGFSSPSMEEFMLFPSRFTFSYFVDRSNARKTTRVIHTLTGWPAIFRTRTALLALNSLRPLIKRFPPDSPFDFEKSPKAKWILPQLYLCPRFEMLACIDDDILFPGSSLQSRALSADSEVRSSQQHDSATIKIVKFYSLRNLLGRSRVAKSIVSRIDPNFIIRHNFKRFLYFFISIRYSFKALITSLMRIDEFRLRKSAYKFLRVSR